MQEGVLTEFLAEHRKEVISVWTQLYDQAEVTRLTMREVELRGEKRGEKRGREEEREQGICFLTVAMQKVGQSLDDTIRMVAEQYGLTEEEAAKKVTQYWKA